MRGMGPKKNMTSHPNVGRGVRGNSNQAKVKGNPLKNLFPLFSLKNIQKKNNSIFPKNHLLTQNP